MASMASMASLGAASGTRADEDLARAIALSEGSSACAWTWMAPGYSSTMTLPATERNHRRFPALTVEHGSALSLIARGTAVLNEEFANVDIGSDFKKWSKIGARPYFFAVVEPHTRQLHSVLRCLLDGDFESSCAVGGFAPQCSHRRIVIEYLSTPKTYQGRGYASRLLQLVKDAALSFSNCNVFVSSLEESCPYWMAHDFVLEQGEINKRLNSFPDTHLLKLVTNKPDVFPPLPSSSEEDDDDDSEGSDEEEEDDEDDDEELQRALVESLLHSNGNSIQGSSGGGEENIEDDAALQAAIALSVSSENGALIDLS